LILEQGTLIFDFRGFHNRVRRRRLSGARSQINWSVNVIAKEKTVKEGKIDKRQRELFAKRSVQRNIREGEKRHGLNL